MESKTPKTDAAVLASNGQWSYELKQCSQELECELAEIKEVVAEFLGLLAIKEESDSGRVFHPNTIQSCRTYDLARIGALINQMESMTNTKGERNEQDA